MDGAASKAASLLGGAKKNESCFPSLTFKQRLTGFFTCMILGMLINLFSFGSFISFAKGNYTRFAVTYTLGNFIALLGTTFLVGPQRQFKNMTDKTRLFTSVVYILSLIGTVVSAFVLKDGKIVLIFIIIQFFALIWYSLSYIPYARTLVKKCFKKKFVENNA